MELAVQIDHFNDGKAQLFLEKLAKGQWPTREEIEGKVTFVVGG